MLYFIYIKRGNKFFLNWVKLADSYQGQVDSKMENTDKSNMIKENIIKEMF